MAAVLPSEDNSYFAASSLRRSHSHSTFISSASPYFPSSHLSEHYQPASKSSAEFNSSSTSSSPHTAHADSVDLSYSSTPTTNLPIASDYDTIGIVELPEGNFMFPSFAQEKLYVHPEIRPDTRHDDNLELPQAPEKATLMLPLLQNTRALRRSLMKHQDPKHWSTKNSNTQRTTLQSQVGPSRQVDYLSHEWREEISGPHGDTLAWIKAKNNLKTIPPESINWLKDCDVTWLYGPLQSGPKNLHPTYTEPLSVPLSNADSLLTPTRNPF
ncbi:hypothetical protein FPOA_12686 [Fusarium poae]|uniref:Nitrogen regulatory protein areA GATA-like domain-containing protein n=1 Tax=Fusarium poae TaxID=36050 RepID=A0A1B8A8D9_FUSPO|nr:hypothetical protein FPOA_12686 [Fusarium poae]